MKKCPYCAEEIQDDAIKCKHCKEQITTSQAVNVSTKSNNMAPKQNNMKKLAIGIPLAILVFLLFWVFGRFVGGTNFNITSKGDLVAKIKKSIQEDYINKNEAYKGLALGDIALTKESSNKYTGYVEFKNGNETEKSNLEVTTDGDGMTYKCDPPRSIILKKSLDEISDQLYELKRNFKEAILNGKPVNKQMIEDLKKYELGSPNDVGVVTMGITVGDLLQIATTVQTEEGASFNVKVEKNSSNINLIFETQKENFLAITVFFCRNINNQGAVLMAVAGDNNGQYSETTNSDGAASALMMLCEAFKNAGPRKNIESPKETVEHDNSSNVITNPTTKQNVNTENKVETIVDNKAQTDTQILKVKGLYIGMNIDDASQILHKLLNIPFEVKECNETEQIMYSFDPSLEVKYVIWCNEGMVTIIVYAGKDKKVNRIMFPSSIVDKLFNVSGGSAEDFAKQFASAYKLPDMKFFSDNFARQGWEYESADGYKIQIYNTKELFITKFPKKSEMKFN